MDDRLDIAEWFSGGEEGKESVAVSLDRHLSERGYFILVSHGFPLAQLHDRLKMEAIQFFQLKEEEKLVYNHGSYGHPSGGYTPLNFESVSKSIGKNQKDAVESFCFWGNPRAFKMPEGSSSHLIPFQEVSAALWDTYVDLLKTIHKIAAKSLGIKNEEYFNERYFGKEEDGKDCANGLTLKISFYPKVETCVDGDQAVKPLRYGEHTDYQGFTILKPDSKDWLTGDQGGLEVKDKVTGLWGPVQISQSEQESAVVVNAGDLITHWSNSRWHSPVHRVRGPVNTLSSGSSVESNRVSIIFFTGPKPETIVEPITQSVDEPRLFAPITAGQHLERKIAASRSTPTPTS